VNLRGSYLGITQHIITTGLAFVVWMMKGFFDEIPPEYEEAQDDGFSRLEAIWKIVCRRRCGDAGDGGVCADHALE